MSEVDKNFSITLPGHYDECEECPVAKAAVKGKIADAVLVPEERITGATVSCDVSPNSYLPSLAMVRMNVNLTVVRMEADIETGQCEFAGFRTVGACCGFGSPVDCPNIR